MKKLLSIILACVLCLTASAQSQIIGNLVLQKIWNATGDVTATQIVANTNNYAPTSFSSAFTLRISSDAARDLTGIAAGTSGRIIILANVGSFTITLKNASGSSSAGNKFNLPGAADFALTAGSTVMLRYDNTTTTWMMVGPGPIGSGTVTSVAMTVPTLLSIAGSPITTTGTLALTYSGTALPVANGGTALTSGTSGGVLAYTASGVLASSAALTANSPVLGGGAGVVPKVVAGITSDGASVVTLGVAGGVVGGVVFKNATSGSITVNPSAGALGASVLSLPIATDTLVGKATTDTLTNKTLTSPVINGGTGTSLAMTSTITSTGGGVGYATGAGGTISQATNKGTGVTLDKLTGTITMNAAALANATSVSFTLTDSQIAATDVVKVTVKSGGTAGGYLVGVGATAAGSCSITLYNCSGGSLSEAVVLSFVVVKGVAA